MVTDNIETDLDITNGAQGEIVDIIPHPEKPPMLGRHLTVPNPQEDKNKGNEIERFSVDTKGGIPREQNRELTTT